MSNHQDPNQHSSTGMAMYIIAWIIGFGLLAAFFNEWLNDQQNPNKNHAIRSQNGYQELILQPNKQHHYFTSGTINQQEVVFLLDTGATDVAVPAKLAKQLGLARGHEQIVITANGRARAYATTIQSLTMGPIKLSNISASINPGMKDNVILLGMSALKQLEFSQKGELLILRQ